MTPLQITIDCSDPASLVAFWSAALGYEPAPPPDGFASWYEWYRSVGVPEDELLDGEDVCDRLVDPAGAGPRIWFQVVPEAKRVKNRMHFDLGVEGGRDVPLEVRRPRVERRVDELVALGATVLYRMDGDAAGHYSVTLADPEGNEFCIG